MDTRWRFLDDVKENPHKYKGNNKTSESQMNPCETCKIFKEEYMEYSNKNKDSIGD